ncbi:MAG: TetR/AcrR family transcriptional regulator [Terrisporobacter sp.]|uniref:TetR/AcrR family transcriptional regulator n=1 Tax=Terrisporobacter sp. TaxID=1965305 RepID=UPI002FCBB2CA
MPKTKEQCEEIKEKMKNRILESSIEYFAKNGYSGTKITQLAKYIGIGQGTLYIYFANKEELFTEIMKKLNSQNENGLENLVKVKMDSESKIKLISESMVENIKNKSIIAYSFALNIRMVQEQSADNQFTRSYENIPVKALRDIILQGQQEGSVIEGDPYKLSDYYWSVVHTLALININSNENQTLEVNWLNRILLKDK